jgi:hypothetical protein
MRAGERLLYEDPAFWRAFWDRLVGAARLSERARAEAARPSRKAPNVVDMAAWRRRRRGRRFSTLAALGFVGLLLATPSSASAQDRNRVDLYRPDGQRAGYAIVDRESGRVDFYDPASRRTGYGQVDATGGVERFDLKGRREPATVVPPVSPGKPSR